MKIVVVSTAASPPVRPKMAIGLSTSYNDSARKLKGGSNGTSLCAARHTESILDTSNRSTGRSQKLPFEERDKKRTENNW